MGLCTMCAEKQSEMRIDITTHSGEVVYVNVRVCPDCITKITTFINEEWGE